MTTLPDMDSLCLSSYEITAGIPQRSGIASISLIGVCRSSAHRELLGCIGRYMDSYN